MSRHGSGDLVAGRYRLTEHIATGGMGEVWQADDEVLQRPVAVKLLTKGLKDTEGFDERFRSEARHSAQLHHHNIAAVHDFGEDDDGAWLVMEYVPGLTVAQMIRDRGALPPEEVADLMTQAARALGAAHSAGVVHRDVKPANVIVTPSGVAKLTDFGISRAVDSAGLTRTGEVMGTAQYLAPEQLMGRGASPASDLYSLGVVAHEMLTGERPYERESVVATAMAHVNEPIPPLPASTPGPLAAVVTRLMAKDPADRPQGARELVAMLTNPDAVAAAPPRVVGPDPADEATRPVAAPPVRRRSIATTQGHPVMANLDRPAAGGSRRAPQRRRGFPWAWFLAAVLLVGLAAALLAMVLGGGDEPPPVSDGPSTVTRTTTHTNSPDPTEDPTTEPDTPADPTTTIPTTTQDPVNPTPDPTTTDPTTAPTTEPTTTDPTTAPTTDPTPTPTAPSPTQSPEPSPTDEPSPTSEPTTTGPGHPTGTDSPTTEPGPDPTPTTEPSPTDSPEPSPTDSPSPSDSPSPTDSPLDPTASVTIGPINPSSPDITLTESLDLSDLA
ncbi:serine/threonine protein kinase [Kytococcus schroeteri]|uniref:non-specific serine/threonine protein kinase n=3 Tax=Kytococcus TaxID=57499 RepID=A0A2I1PCR1_9MICO|nr:serine/threonine-protein kinase [Kytococcus schroeteri]PKZ42425.1 serine/threonine protein kinase [Kytococcus schroeteri]